MSEIAIGIAGIGLMLLLAACGLPMVLSIIVVGLSGVFLLSGLSGATQIAASVPFNFIADCNFAVFLVGAVAQHAGRAGNLYNLAYVWFASFSLEAQCRGLEPQMGKYSLLKINRDTNIF